MKLMLLLHFLSKLLVRQQDLHILRLTVYKEIEAAVMYINFIKYCAWIIIITP